MVEIITKEYNEKIYIPEELNSTLSSKRYCFFDIETTGFNRITDKVILIGISYIDNGKLKISQFFANNPKEEKNLLIKFKEFIKDFEILINYNGEAFDIPFLNSKYSLYNINFTLDLNNSIDLLKVIRKNKIYLSLDNHRLKSVEKYLGINRDDIISGRESVKLYKKYIKSKDNSIKETIIKHNFDDIYYLPKVLEIFEVINKNNKITFSLNYTNTEFTFMYDLTTHFIDNNVLKLEGTTSTNDLPEEIHFNENYSLKWSPNSGVVSLTFEVYEGKLSTGEKCIYLNKEQYPFKIEYNDGSIYKVPSNIIILKTKDLIIDNLNPLINEITNKILLG